MNIENTIFTSVYSPPTLTSVYSPPHLHLYTPPPHSYICILPPPTHTHTQCTSASEFIRSHISSGGFSDPRTGKTHTISDVSYIVTGHLDDQSGGVVGGRLLKHFNVLHWDGYKYAVHNTISCYFHSQEFSLRLSLGLAASGGG